MRLFIKEDGLEVGAATPKSARRELPATMNSVAEQGRTLFTTSTLTAQQARTHRLSSHVAFQPAPDRCQLQNPSNGS
ncbi:hypothetical protein ACVWVS_001927 [Ewingella americana]